MTTIINNKTNIRAHPICQPRRARSTTTTTTPTAMFPRCRLFTSFRVIVTAMSFGLFLCVYSFFFQSPPPVHQTTMTTNDDFGRKKDKDVHKSLPSSSTSSTRGYSFEVFGIVQGVSFRKYTQQQALELGMRGWIRNTYRNTVEGEFYYDDTAGAAAETENLSSSTTSLLKMKLFLEKKGFPTVQSTVPFFMN